MSEAAPPLLSADAPEALAVGTRVAEFEVRRVLGSGGFGIVYLAWDHALEREVALKEYMPGTLAGRGAGLLVSVRSKATADTFALGLRSFINEGRLLARFDHPSLVKVYRFWEDNGTAYMVMPYYQGRTLRQARQGMVVPPGEGACRRVLDALLSALETLHREGVYHRDIAPDNILLGDDGLPVLLDFGAARRVLGDRTQALTSIMKPHYAPLEQYADASAMRQGPWTDLYALGGTMYFLLTAQEPVAAASRALHDDQPRLAELRPRDCTQGFLSAIDWMLALKPPERPQSVHMLRDVLEGRITLPGRAAADKTAPGVAARLGTVAGAAVRTDIDPSEPVHSGARADDDAAAAAATAAKAAAITLIQVAPMPALAPAAPVATASAAPVAPAASAPRQPSRMLGLLGALVCLNLLAWWWFTRPSPSEAAQPPVAATLEAPAPASLPTGKAAPVVTAAPAPEGPASETILSVLPARPVPARPAAAASEPAPRPIEAAAPVRPRANNDPAPPAAAALPAAALGPRARCGERNFLSMLICVKRECDDPALHGHAECVKMREQEAIQRGRQ
ncbi:MAG: serine/threonine-protein kinase [Pseudomonadota bacterium]